MEILEPDSEGSSTRDISMGRDEWQDVCEEDQLDDKENERPRELLIPITLDNGDVLMPKFSELDELVPPKWSIFYRSRSGRNKRFNQQRSSTSGSNLTNNSNTFSRFFILSKIF